MTPKISPSKGMTRKFLIPKTPADLLNEVENQVYVENQYRDAGEDELCALVEGGPFTLRTAHTSDWD